MNGSAGHWSPDRRAGIQKTAISLRRALASLLRWMTAAIWLLFRATLIGGRRSTDNPPQQCSDSTENAQYAYIDVATLRSPII